LVLISTILCGVKNKSLPRWAVTTIPNLVYQVHLEPHVVSLPTHYHFYHHSGDVVQQKTKPGVPAQKGYYFLTPKLLAAILVVHSWKTGRIRPELFVGLTARIGLASDRSGRSTLFAQISRKNK